jgi:hypothetical protein
MKTRPWEKLNDLQSLSEFNRLVKWMANQFLQAWCPVWNKTPPQFYDNGDTALADGNKKYESSKPK